MEDFLSTVLDCVTKANPLYGVALLAVWLIFGDRIKGLLALIPWKKSAAPAPGVTADPLEDHPLLDLIWQRVKKKFQNLDPNMDFDDLYVKVVKALKDVQ